MQYIIGVDIGTTSTKGVAFDLNGNVLFRSSVPNITFNRKKGFAEQELVQLFSSVLTVLKEVIENRGSAGLVGISFSCAMHSIAAVDAEGDPLTGALIWADNRASEYAIALKNSPLGMNIYEQTGTPIHPMSPLCKIAWLRDHQPEIFGKTFKFVSIKEFIFYQFFQKWLVDESIASATGLFDISARKWCAPALSFAGISEDKLSLLVSVFHVETAMNKTLAEQLGIPAGTPLVLGGNDGALANLGVGAIEAGSAVVTIGTSSAVRVVSKHSKPERRGRLFNYIVAENYYIQGGGSNCGGGTFEWFLENFYRDKDISQVNEDIFAAKASEEIIFLPYLLGERAPLWNSSARGAFFGLTENHGRADMARAVMEGVAFNLKMIAEMLELTAGPIKDIYATGGFGKSETWVQILCDIFNMPVKISNSLEGSALGAAIVGMKALGLIQSIEEVKRLTTVTKEYRPDEKTAKRYEKTFSLFKSLATKLNEEFYALGNLKH